jgi:hypothetical protein
LFPTSYIFQRKGTTDKGNDLLLLDRVVHVGEAALAAVLPVEVGSHEDAGTAVLAGALAAQTVDLESRL